MNITQCDGSDDWLGPRYYPPGMLTVEAMKFYLPNHYAVTKGHMASCSASGANIIRQDYVFLKHIYRWPRLSLVRTCPPEHK